MTVAAQAVLDAIEAEGCPHLGPVSRQHGFLLAEPPPPALPPAWAAWDEAAAALPALWRDVAVRRALDDELPALPAGALPDTALHRAAMVLGGLAFSYVRCDLHALEGADPVPLPPQLLEPWRVVCRRLGRPSPRLAFDDVMTHNFRLLDPAGAVVVENMEPLVPLLGNPTEAAFRLATIEVQARLSPVVAASARAQQAAVDGDRGGLVAALLTVLEAVRDATEVAFAKVDPHPRARRRVDPVVWGRLVALDAAPLTAGVPGVSGTAASGFQLVDVLLGRASSSSKLGRETHKHRALMAPHVRRLLDAVERTSLRDHVHTAGDREVSGLFASIVEAFAGERGYLGVHRRKAYGFIETGFRTGRAPTAAGTAVSDRGWRATDEDLALARDERHLALGGHVHRARLRRRSPAVAGGGVQHVALDVSGAGLVLRPGDRCEVLIEHTDALVARTIEALRGAPDRLVPLSDRWRAALQRRTGAPPPARLPLGEVLRVARLRPLEREVAERLHELSGAPGLRQAVEARAEDRLELWDALELAAAAGFDVTRLWRSALWQDEALTRLVAPEPSRTYSLSDLDTDGAFATSAGLTVGRLAFESAGTARQGAASTFLADTARTGTPIAVRVVRPLRFALPQEPGDPVVLIAGGTGLAPFRGFVQARAADPRAGSTWLLAAARTPGQLPHREELETLAASGRLHLVTAYSREAPEGQPRRRIDEAIRAPATADVLRELLAGDRARFYVCGAAGFARTALDALAGLAGEEADALERLAGEGRLLTDLFTTAAPRSSPGPLGDLRCDASELVLHNDDEHGWWMAIDGALYDVTQFRRLHPGGTTTIDHNCGVDATSEWRAVLHHEDSEIRAMLDLCKAGALRRPDFAGAWGVALVGGRLRHVPVLEAHQRWLCGLYAVVERQNALRSELGLVRSRLTAADLPGEPTKLQALFAVVTAQRLLDVHARALAGPWLVELWQTACGLLDARADARELPRALAAVDATAARAAVRALADVGRRGALSAEVGSVLRAELGLAGEVALAAFKAALRDGLLPFERHEGAVLDHGAPVLDALRTLPAALERLHADVGAAAARAIGHEARGAGTLRRAQPR